MDTHLKEIILDAFNKIDSVKLLKIARTFQLEIDKGNIKSKGFDGWGLVTNADLELQNEIIEYFNSVPILQNTFNIKAEEEITNELYSQNDAKWVLIIDPLDGTKEFINATEKWGIMIAAGEINGDVFYSMCILADGRVYSSEMNQSIYPSVNNTIDIFDYSNNFNEKLGREIVNTFGENLSISAYPSAIYACSQVMDGICKGLVWLPSKTGKKHYPLYDLIFLPILLQRFHSRIYCSDGDVVCLILSPTKKQNLLISEILLENYKELESYSAIEDRLPTYLNN